MLVKNCGSLVISHDHIGHGRSSGTRVHIDSMDDLVDPVIEHIKAVVKLHPGLKTFVYGHSMGGLISLFAIFKKQEMFSGFVASGPLVMPDPDVATPIMRFLAQVLQVVAPYFALKKLEIDQVTRDKDVVARRYAQCSVFFSLSQTEFLALLGHFFSPTNSKFRDFKAKTFN